MSHQLNQDLRERVIRIEKISEIQEMLQNMATLMIAYPDATEDQSNEWLTTLNVCRVELRRRHKSRQVRLAPKTTGTSCAQNESDS